jgi:hypothetical protein
MGPEAPEEARMDRPVTLEPDVPQQAVTVAITEAARVMQTDPDRSGYVAVLSNLRYAERLILAYLAPGADEELRERHSQGDSDGRP